MVAILFPSSFAITFYLAFVAKQEFSTWISNLVAGIQQLILLICCIIFGIKNRILKKSKEEPYNEI
jgi:hypothetical protein